LILAQALVDVLRFELGLPVDNDADEFDAYAYVTRYDKLRKRLLEAPINKKKWVKELETALGRELNE